MQLKKSNTHFLLWMLPCVMIVLLLLASSKKSKKKAIVIPSIVQKTNFKSIQILFKEKRFNKIKAKRDEALTVGVLQTEDNDIVPAVINYNGEAYKADIRLKGDWTDHLEGDKWSFRIKLKNGHTIMGMRKFSIHHPGTRGYLNEWLYHKAIKDKGIMGLRYGFLEGFLHVDLKELDTVLTKEVGLYAIEETFDKRLIENNQRKVGVIFKLTEDDMWKESAKTHELARSTGTSATGKYNPRYGKENKMTITAYGLKGIFEDEALNKQFILAKNLLNSYKNGQLPISEVFDVEVTAKFTALANLFGGVHGLTPHNLRFFYNPITSMIEPIAFDNNSGVLLPEFRHYWKSSNDPVFIQALIKALEEVSIPEYLEKLTNKYQAEMDSLSLSLKKEFPNEPILSIEVLKKNQEMMRSTLAYLEREIGKKKNKRTSSK